MGTDYAKATSVPGRRPRAQRLLRAGMSTPPIRPAGRLRAQARTPGAVAAAGALVLVGATIAWTARVSAPDAPPQPAARPAAPDGLSHLAPQPAVPGGPPLPAPAAVAEQPFAAPAPAGPRPLRADFAGEHAPRAVRRVADWAVGAADPRGLPFMIIDKSGARLYAFGADGRGRGSAPVLLGLARGDASVPGIGERPLKSIRPEERTTPAGRYLAEAGRNLRGEDIVWIDYDAAVSMHRVRATQPRERRLQRLASPTVADNRISYGCVNVPPAFYDGVVRPLLLRGRAVVYVLPERQTLRAVFGPMEIPVAGAQAPLRAVAARSTAR